MSALTLPEPAATIAEIKNDIAELSSYLDLVAKIQNRMTEHLLNGDAAGFANHVGPPALESMLTESKAIGDATNRAYRECQKWAGTPTDADIVDVSPFASKLAARGKELIHDGTQFALVDLPSQP